MALQKAEIDQRLGVLKAFQVLEANLPGFERRKEQFDLTDKISICLTAGQNLVAEAPTGTGKSFAIALGILSAYYGTGLKAVIATANNNLLEQYASKDLPFVQSLFPDLQWARAKGKNNYSCLDKGEKLFGQQTLFGETAGLKNLQRWYDSTETGDREEINFKLDEKDWLKINADDTCTGRKCPFYEDCHYFQAKKKLNTAQIIVTNYDLVLLDLFNPEIQIFPHYDALIMDEAHQLEEKAISKLEKSLTHLQVVRYLKRAEQNFGVEDKGYLQSIDEKITKLFSLYRKLLEGGDEKKSIIPNEALTEATADFVLAMGSLKNQIYTFKTPEGTRLRKSQENLMDAVATASNAAMAAIKNNPKNVSWVEAAGSDIKVITCPFRVAGKLHKMLFGGEKTVITLSATLSTGKKGGWVTASDGTLKVAPVFEQFRGRNGITSAGEFVCPSPFDYRKNCVLYLPKPPEGVTDPKNSGWGLWAKNQALELVKLSQGRALILTTSSANCTEFATFLNQHSGYPVKPQGAMPNSQLIEWFKNTPNSILVGTASFWEGVSIEGDDLKLVIIDKIPFTPHTDPIQQAREAWYKADEKRKGRVFMDLQLYPAIIKIKQGFGRLIRTKSDTGVVAMLDPRLTFAKYKGVILGALPNAQKVTELSDPRLIRILQ